ncbi:hypothetical protein VTJ04DRAFT_10601 [Mycothermus thermophilus]|uniref:uncharacterized protein n=1 Tax=Humicola insolens TaxID=85995 RepID=UPI00374216C9
MFGRGDHNLPGALTSPTYAFCRFLVIDFIGLADLTLMVGKGFGRIIIKLGRYGGAITNTAEDLGRERSRRDIVCVFGLLSAAEGLFLLCLSEMGRDGMEWVGRDYYMEF